jgi:hypothetical protein
MAKQKINISRYKNAREAVFLTVMVEWIADLMETKSKKRKEEICLAMLMACHEKAQESGLDIVELMEEDNARS